MATNMNMCRACLTTKDTFAYVLFQNVAPDIYCFCTSIEVSEDENLPLTICNSCYDQIKQFSDFKTTCLQSQKTLLGLQNSIKLEKEDGEVINDSFKYNYKENESIKEDNSIKEEGGTDKEPEGNDIGNKINNTYPTVGDQESNTSPSFQQIKIEQKNKIIRKAKRRMPKRLRKHSKNTSENYRLTCHICKKKIKYADHFEAHKLSHEGKTATISCKICNKTYNNWSNLRKHHVNYHTQVKMDTFKCHKCGKVLLNKDSLRNHMLWHRNKDIMNYYICDVCGKNMSSQPALERHIKTHNENRERKFSCQHCDKKYFDNQNLTKHITNAHKADRERYICHLCSTTFTCKKSLHTHILVHQGIKEYKCDLCDGEFSKLQTLIIHKRTHSGEKPYSCVLCEKSFISKSRLSDHIRTHTGERPHKCKVCNQAYIQRGSLARHMKIHNKLPVLGLKFE